MQGLAPVSLAVLVLLAPSPVWADPCPKDRLGALPRKIADGGTAIAYRTEPAKIAIGKPFSIEVVACVGGEKRMAPSRIRVDAGMPTHGHGMNYTPSESKLGPGHSTFDGLVFHMPGRWQITFDIFEGEKRRRLLQKVTIGR
jgi:hypothetical protein